MPAIDLPLDELRSYLGSQIVADDFRNYWDKQVMCVDNLGIQFNLKAVPHVNSSISCFELWFNGIDGAQQYAKFIRPNHQKDVPLVLHFHDHLQSSKSWFHLARYAALDYAVLALDCRGQGGRSVDINTAGPSASQPLINGLHGNVDDLYYRRLYLDVYRLTRIAKFLPNINSENLMTTGMGQGGALAIVGAALNPDITKCIIRDPFLADFKRVWEMDLDVASYEGLRYYFRWFDPMHEREKEIFLKLSYLDIVNFAPMINGDVLLGSGLLNTVCPPSTQFAFYNQVAGCKSHRLFPKSSHELINVWEDEVLKEISKG